MIALERLDYITIFTLFEMKKKWYYDRKNRIELIHYYCLENFKEILDVFRIVSYDDKNFCGFNWNCEMYKNWNIFFRNN